MSRTKKQNDAPASPKSPVVRRRPASPKAQNDTPSPVPATEETTAPVPATEEPTTETTETTTETTTEEKNDAPASPTSPVLTDAEKDALRKERETIRARLATIAVALGEKAPRAPKGEGEKYPRPKGATCPAFTDVSDNYVVYYLHRHALDRVKAKGGTYDEHLAHLIVRRPEWASGYPASVAAWLTAQGKDASVLPKAKGERKPKGKGPRVADTTETGPEMARRLADKAGVVQAYRLVSRMLDDIAFGTSSHPEVEPKLKDALAHLAEMRKRAAQVQDAPQDAPKSEESAA